MAAVVNRAQMISGRFPNRGPADPRRRRHPMVDQADGTGGRDLLAAIADGRRVRAARGTRAASATRWSPRAASVDADDVVATSWPRPRPGWPPSSRPSRHNSAEFLRREEALLLHGEGLPRLRTRIAGRPGRRGRPGPRRRGRAARASAATCARCEPVVIATGDGLAVTAGGRADAPTSSCSTARTEELPAGQGAARRPRRRRHRAARRRATGRRAPSGSSGSASARCAMQTAATPADAALLLADARRRRADRRGRAARHARGVPRRQPRRAGQQLRHPAQGRAPPRRRHRRADALLRPAPRPPRLPRAPDRADRGRRGDRDHRRRPPVGARPA